MKRITIIIAAMLMGFASEIHAQSRLTPALATTSKCDIKYRYYINKILHQNDADFYYFAFEIRPSFHGESFCFYNIQKEEVVYRIAKRSIYYTNSNMINNNDSDKKKEAFPNSNDVEVTEYRCPLSKDIAEHFKQLFKAAVNSSSFLAERIGCDGVSYQIYNGSLWSARCWTPDARTNCGKLVQILEEITEYTKENKPKEIEKMIPEVDELCKTFEALYPEDLVNEK